jgi:hypothetical protein
MTDTPTISSMTPTYEEDDFISNQLSSTDISEDKTNMFVDQPFNSANPFKPFSCNFLAAA